MQTTRQPFDKFLWGFVPAMLLPLAAIFILFLFHQEQLHMISFWSYINHVVKYQLLSKVLSITLLSNLIVFYLFLHFNKLQAVRGVLTATIIYGLFIVGYVILK